MANTFQSASKVQGKIASIALQTLIPDTVLARTVNRDVEKDFTGGVGNVVNVKSTAVLQARSRNYGDATAITVDNITEPATQPVTLSKHLYSAVRISDEDLALEITDFTRDVLAPQTNAIAVGIEEALAAEMHALTATTGLNDTDIPGTFANARQFLRDLGVPVLGLTCAVGTGVASEILKTDLVRRADASGSNDALTMAKLAPLMGFNIVESNLIDPNEAVFYHRDAFTLALRAPVVPEGAPYGQSISADGFSLRWIRDYDSQLLADRSVLSTFLGTKTMKMTKQKDGAQVTPAVRIVFA
jgi:P22 coat protein - gene protein 5